MSDNVYLEYADAARRAAASDHVARSDAASDDETGSASVDKDATPYAIPMASPSSFVSSSPSQPPPPPPPSALESASTQSSERARRDGCAVASAACGFTGFIPVITQVIGVALAIAAMVRIRRARRAGKSIAGMPHAVTGLVANGVTLIIWVVVLAGLAVVGHSLSESVGQLGKLVPPR